MARFYEMQVTVEILDGNTESKEEGIKDAISEEMNMPAGIWSDFPPVTDADGKVVQVARIVCTEQLYLNSGEDEEEFAQRVSMAGWKANGAWCPITIRATYLEDLPYEDHSFDEEEYASMIVAEES